MTATLTWRRVAWALPAGGAARRSLTREAILVTLTDGDRVAHGEAAPLPGMSRETLDEVEAELAAGVAHAPSLRFAIEMAERGLAGPPALEALPLAAVVDTADEARAAVARGAVALKVKVGDADEVARVRAIHAVAPGIALRLDANGSWPVAEAAARAGAFAGLPIDYVEEPCASLVESLPLPIALDESLSTMTDAEIAAAIARPGVAALILKPSLLGGLARCVALAAIARAAGKRAIASHMLEGPIGMAACAEVALALGHREAVTVQPMSHARAIVATADNVDATVIAIRAALDTRTPLAILHGKLAPDELARQRALVATYPVPRDTAFVLFTSGSTGAPRGVVLSRAAIEANAAASASHLGWRHDDAWLLALPLAHAGGLSVVARCHLANRPVVIADELAPSLARATLASLVPTQLAALLDDRAWQPPKGLRAILLGGAAAPPALLARAAARGVPFLRTYGLTESFGQLATTAPDRAGDPDAPLVTLPGVTFEAGTRDAPTTVHVRAPMLATSYLDGAPIAPALTTSDLGFLEDNALHLVGRADDVIITGGENVHPSEVEVLLLAAGGLRAACVFGVPDARWGQLVGAAIVLEPGADPDEVAAHWATLPAHQRPRTLAIVEALPLLPNGKVDRRAAAALPRTR